MMTLDMKVVDTYGTVAHKKFIARLGIYPEGMLWKEFTTKVLAFSRKLGEGESLRELAALYCAEYPRIAAQVEVIKERDALPTSTSHVNWANDWGAEADGAAAQLWKIATAWQEFANRVNCRWAEASKESASLRIEIKDRFDAQKSKYNGRVAVIMQEQNPEHDNPEVVEADRADRKRRIAAEDIYWELTQAELFVAAFRADLEALEALGLRPKEIE